MLNKNINFEFEDYRDYKKKIKKLIVSGYLYELASNGFFIIKRSGGIALSEDEFNEKLRVINRNVKFGSVTFKFKIFSQRL